MCEPILFKYTDNACGVVFRPATVCGSPWELIRLNHAYHNKVIKVFGGTT